MLPHIQELLCHIGSGCNQSSPVTFFTPPLPTADFGAVIPVASAKLKHLILNAKRGPASSFKAVYRLVFGIVPFASSVLSC